MPTALITGVAGQDGSYLAEFLIGRGYRVVGTTRDLRRALELPYARALAGVELIQGSIESSPDFLRAILERERPDEVYHLGGPSKVSASWANPAATTVDIVLPAALIIEAAAETLPSPRL